MTATTRPTGTERALRAALCLAAAATALSPVMAAAQTGQPRGQQGRPSAQQTGEDLQNEARQQSRVDQGPGFAREAPVRRNASNWSLDLNATYSDNYRRVPEDATRYLFYQDTLATPFGVLPVGPPGVATDTVSIDPPSNVILSATLRGASVYDRPGLTGVISGSVQVSGYTDNEEIDQRVLDDLLSPIEPGSLPDGIEPTEVQAVTLALGGEEEIFIRPDIAGSATLRLAEDLFYVDVSGLAQQQSIARNAELENESAGQVGDQTTYVGGSISPYFTREVAGGGAVEARYRLSAITVADEEFEPRPLPGEEVPDEGQQFANDSVSHQVLAEYRSGEVLDRIAFLIRAEAAENEETGSDILDEITLRRLSGSGKVAYDLSRQFAVTGEIGYDEIEVDVTDPNPELVLSDPNDPNSPLVPVDDTDDDALSDDFSGVFWSVGFEYEPTRKTLIAASIGERFGGTQFEGSVRYQPNPRLSIRAIAERELGTGAEATFDAFRALNGQTLGLVEQLSRVQQDSASRLLDRAVGFQGGTRSVFRQQAGLSVRNDVRIGATYTLRRTDFSADLFWNEAEFPVGQNGVEGDRTNSTYGVDLATNRQLSRRLSLNARARVRRNEGTFPEDRLLGLPSGQDEAATQTFLSAGASYALGRNLALTGQVYHSRRDVDGEVQTVGTRGTGLEFEENAVSAGIRWTF